MKTFTTAALFILLLFTTGCSDSLTGHEPQQVQAGHEPQQVQAKCLRGHDVAAAGGVELNCTVNVAREYISGDRYNRFEVVQRTPEADSVQVFYTAKIGYSDDSRVGMVSKDLSKNLNVVQTLYTEDDFVESVDSMKVFFD